jgi:C4-dicarboxylate-specific signal transduction histidine kinase
MTEDAIVLATRTPVTDHLSSCAIHGSAQRLYPIHRSDDEGLSQLEQRVRSKQGGCESTMQQQNVFPMKQYGTDVPFLRAVSWDKKNMHKRTDSIAAVTSWKSELEGLEHARQMQIESMMMLVHELRSPATASKSMVATLRYLNPHDTQLDKFLARIENRMDQLLDLVNDILDLSQAKAGRPLGQATILDAVEETGTVCKPYLEDAAAKQLAMDMELPESALRVRMPKKAYHLIVSNLVSNAIKYTLAGSVRVTLRRQGHCAVLTVEDTGIGIPRTRCVNCSTNSSGPRTHVQAARWAPVWAWPPSKPSSRAVMVN